MARIRPLLLLLPLLMAAAPSRVELRDEMESAADRLAGCVELASGERLRLVAELTPDHSPTVLPIDLLEYSMTGTWVRCLTAALDGLEFEAPEGTMLYVEVEQRGGNSFINHVLPFRDRPSFGAFLSSVPRPRPPVASSVARPQKVDAPSPQPSPNDGDSREEARTYALPRFDPPARTLLVQTPSGRPARGPLLRLLRKQDTALSICRMSWDLAAMGNPPPVLLLSKSRGQIYLNLETGPDSPALERYRNCVRDGLEEPLSHRAWVPRRSLAWSASEAPQKD